MLKPDLLIHGGPIMSLDPAVPNAAALAVRGDRILAIGDEATVRAALRPGYEALNLRGRTALPGLCDAHIHLLWTAQVATQVNLDGVQSLAAALEAVRIVAATLPADAWVLGHGWDHSLWGGRWPTAAELDAVTAGRPAFLTRKDLHSCWVNQAALQRAGISDTPGDPEGGAIGRDERGAANGLLFENAQKYLYAVLPQASVAANERAIQGLTRQFQQSGITSIHVPEGPDCLAAVQTLYGRGELGVRVLHHLRMTGLEAAIETGVRSGLGDMWVRIGGVKIFSDGSLGSHTAHMLAPFSGLPADAPHPRGLPMLPAAELQALVARAIGAGISVTVHAIGDAANRGVLDAIEAAMQQHPEPLPATTPPPPGRGLPHLALIPNRIEHAQILHADDIGRFGRLGVVASIQPIHATSDSDIASDLLGERCRSAYAWRSLLASGAILACGSDAPVESWSPWAGIHAAVTRQRPSGYPEGGWYPEQRLTLEETLWGYTVGPALASGELSSKGTLSAGKLADIIVVDRDLSATDAADLHHVGTDITILNGQVVWER
jgi:predicted amidohydrolase YtcJ